MRSRLGLCALALFASAQCGCLFSDAGGFASGRSENVCDSTVPVCDTSAGCVLDGDHYLTGDFPGARRFIVRTTGEADITVTLYFEGAKSPGADTDIFLFEAGCTEQFSYQSAGRDIFREAGPDLTFNWSTHVYQEGDHLVTVDSDALSGYLLKVDVNELSK